jgi:hypothetical protein
MSNDNECLSGDVVVDGMAVVSRAEAISKDERANQRQDD